MDALRALDNADFQWTTHSEGIWRDPADDVPALHEELRQQFHDRLLRLQRSPDAASPLGLPFLGQAGAGKTHLLGALRREAMRGGAGFVLVDLTDVHDFWSTTLIGYLDSLQKPGLDGEHQGHALLHHIVTSACAPEERVDPDAFRTARPPALINQMDRLVRAVARKHRNETLKHQDILRALVLLESDEFDLANLGHAWLQGHGLGEDEVLKFGFQTQRPRPQEVVRGLSWIMSLHAPTVLAFDQIDAIVTEHNLLATAPAESEQMKAKVHVSRSIIEGIGRGLLELRDLTRRTLTVISCIEATWQVLVGTAMRTAMDRFEAQRVLPNITRPTVASELVARRLARAFSEAGYAPPHPTWPFAPSAFDSALGLSPREVLKRCDQHRRRCLEEGRVTELTTFAASSSQAIVPAASLDDDSFRQELRGLLARAPAGLDDEDDLGDLVMWWARALAIEDPPTDDVDVVVDDRFQARTKSGPPLHARVRAIYRAQSDRERHVCLRVIQHDHPIAYQTRLKAAMTCSGIDRHLEFRRLFIVRAGDPPPGAKTQELTKAFLAAGGTFLRLTSEETRTLWAIARLLERHPGDGRLEAWLQAARPGSGLAAALPLVEWFRASSPLPPRGAIGSTSPVEVGARRSEPVRPPASGAPVAAPVLTPVMTPVLTPVMTPVVTPVVTPAVAPVDARLPIGQVVIGDKPADVRTMAARSLTEHVAVLASAGSGKTVLVKRLVEEAAILGIPSIVVDVANDLARLGDPWPVSPTEWSELDVVQADRYQSAAQVVIWTPGRDAGNPLSLAPLPDFKQVASDPDELAQAIAMAADALGTLAAAGNSEAARMRRGVLTSALEFFAGRGGGSLADFIAILKELPPEVSPISKAASHAEKVADNLLAALKTNPLLQPKAAPLDPGVLFGVGTGRPRVSVVNLMGLPSLEAQQHLVNQLAMTLFTWIRKHPCPADLPLRGLLVIDEAKDFVPSLGHSLSKSSLLRLVAQGRKYGLGLVFATQAPRSIDHNVIANCATQFYGRASSPAAIETIQDQLRQRGGSGADISRLGKGRFYYFATGMPAPAKLAVPLCLSHHPSAPLDESEILTRARAGRQAIATAGPRT